ncbi:CD83 antigen [Tautogolabrus adspersus]
MAVREDLVEVKSVVGEDCKLPCPAMFKPGVDYLAITWYKAIDPPSSRLSGILTRDLPNGTTSYYLGMEREVELLGESPDIFMPNLTCADRGVYTCHLAAPVGEQNRERQVILSLAECSDESTEILVKDAYMVVAATLLLIFALLVFKISYVCLKNIVKERNETTKKETLLDAKLKPLEKKDLMLIQTLGPRPSKNSTMKHVCV